MLAGMAPHSDSEAALSGTQCRQGCSCARGTSAPFKARPHAPGSAPPPGARACSPGCLSPAAARARRATAAGPPPPGARASRRGAAACAARRRAPWGPRPAPGAAAEAAAGGRVSGGADRWAGWRRCLQGWARRPATEQLGGTHLVQQLGCLRLIASLCRAVQRRGARHRRVKHGARWGWAVRRSAAAAAAAAAARPPAKAGWPAAPRAPWAGRWCVSESMHEAASAPGAAQAARPGPRLGVVFLALLRPSGALPATCKTAGTPTARTWEA